MIADNQMGFKGLEDLIAAAPDEQAPRAISADLIPINHENGAPSVNARDLHAFLEVGKDFSTWIKDRIQQFGFIDGQDYSPISGNRSDGLPGKARAEYALSIDMAKELSMVERTEKGKQARQYFIACEKALHQAAPAIRAPQTLREALQLALDQQERIEALETTVSEITPKAEALDRIAEAEGLLNLTNAAKALQVQPKKFIAYLQTSGWIYRRNGSAEWVPYQGRIQSGHMQAKIYTFTSQTTGDEVLKERAMITAKGLALLAKTFSGRNAA